MTHNDRMKLLRTWETRTKAWQKAYNNFCDALGIQDLDSCSVLVEAWSLHENYTSCVSKLVGDDFEWLDWWFYETDMGLKEDLKAKASKWKKDKVIRTLEDLCTLIEADIPKGKK